MKKKIAMLLVCAMAFILVLGGCGNSETGDEETDTAETDVESEDGDGDEVISTEFLLSSTDYDVTEYVTLPDGYMTMDIQEETDYSVTDDDVRADIETNILPYYPVYEEMDKTTIEDGDYVNIDFVGTIEGEEFDGGSADDYTLMVGSGNFIDGFEDGLIDQEVGTDVTLNLTFPDDYYTEDLAGVDVVFVVTVNAIVDPVVLEYDDMDDDYVNENFAYYEIYTVDDLIEYEREYLSEVYIEDEQYEINVLVLSRLMDDSIYSYPEEMLIENYDEYIDEVKTWAEDAGMEYEDYVLEYSDYETLEDFEDDMYLTMKSYLEQELVLEAIVADQGITFTQSEFEEFVEETIAEYGSYYGFSDADGLYDYYGGEDYVMLSYAESIALSNVADSVTIYRADGSLR